MPTEFSDSNRHRVLQKVDDDPAQADPFPAGPDRRAAPRQSPVHPPGGGAIPSLDHNLRIADWFYRSQPPASSGSLSECGSGTNGSRGYQKIWGSEKAAFWFGGGVGVKGFAAAGVAGSTADKGGQLRLVGWFPSQLRHPQRLVDRQTHFARRASHRCRAHPRALHGIGCFGWPHAQHDLHVHRIGRRQPGVHDPRSATHLGLA